MEKESILHTIFSANNGRLSSKRILGAIGFFYYYAMVAYIIFSKIEFPSSTLELLKIIPYCCTGLLGISVAEGIGKKE